GRLVGPGDPEAQARQVFENVRANLAAAGAGFADVVKMTGFVTDFAHMAAIRRVRADYVDADGPPVSTVVLVPRFADPAMLLEIDVVAALA
ncbi:MAG: RidA family protein, partial [Vicinamibacterales bacterium]